MYREALKTFDLVLRRPENIKAIYNIGVVCFKQKLYETACRAFGEVLALTLARTIPEIFRNFLQKSESTRMPENLDRLLRINPRDVQSMNYGGVILGKMERYSEAIKTFNEICASIPT